MRSCAVLTHTSTIELLLLVSSSSSKLLLFKSVNHATKEIEFVFSFHK
jgi:hypothetical protein